LIKLRVAFPAINARRLPLAPLVYTLMTTTVVNNSVFRGFFEKQKLSRPNVVDWYRQLRIVLSAEYKLNYLELPIPAIPVPTVAGQQVPPEILAAHAAWVKGQKEIIELKTLFAQQAEQELLQTVREFHACKQEEGQSVSSYVLKMKGYIDNLERLGHPVSLSLASKKGPEKKKNKNKKPQLAAKGNYKGKGKSKLAYAPKPKIPSPPKKEDAAKDSVYHHCGDTGHWKRNCPQYLSELLKNKKLSQGASTSGIFTIELFTFPGK
ncbi:zinc finger, CCHC-type containing protein, partial [Tanacetum coccineum]